MTVTINSSAITPVLLPPNTAASADGATGFAVEPTPVVATSSTASDSSSPTSPTAQLSTDLQSLLTDLQALGSGGSTVGQTGQVASWNGGADRPHDFHHDEHSRSDVSETSGSATTATTSGLQNEANSVVNDLFGILSGFTNASTGSGTAAAGGSSATTSSSSLSNLAAPTSTSTLSSATTNSPTTGMTIQSLGDLLATDFAQAIQNYSTAGLQTNNLNQINTAV